MKLSVLITILEKFHEIMFNLNQNNRRFDTMDAKLQQILDSAQANHDAAAAIIGALGQVKDQVAALQAQLAQSIAVTEEDLAAIDAVIDDATADLQAAVA